MPNAKHKIVLAGGSGFLGWLLIDWFDRLQWDVIVLSRQPSAELRPARLVGWDGKSLGDWARELEGATALVNLAGRSVNCRYHARNRKAILESRVNSTRVLASAVATCTRPPQVWLNSSTATIYQHSYDRAMDEVTGTIAGSAEAKDQFSIDVAIAWENAFDDALAPATRKLALRTAMVFGDSPGTVYRVLRRLARCGLGGAMGSGRQYVSWLHHVDFCRAIEWLIAREDLAGVVNLAAPQPVSNREMMRAVREACHMPVGLPASHWMLDLGALLLRTETELVIKSRRVVPARLLAAGFEFRFATFREAIEDLERQRMKARF